jgi:cysteine desulfurase
LYEEFRFTALVFGGEQEKACVPEEAVHQIAGMAKALELSYDNLEEERAQI